MRPNAVVPAALALAATFLGAVTGHVQRVAAAAPIGPAPILVDVQSDAPLSLLMASPIALTPAFSVGTTDYALHCAAGSNKLTLTIGATSGHVVTHWSFTAAAITDGVDVAEGQAIVVQRSNTQDIAQETYWIRCLPHDFPAITVSRPGAPAPGWYMTGTLAGGPDAPYAMILDSNGTPVWYAAAPGGALVVEPGLPVSNTNQTTVAYTPLPPNPGFNIVALNGDDSQTTTVQTLNGKKTDAHELLLLPNGNRVVLSYPLTAGVDLSNTSDPQHNFGTNQTIQDCDIQEISANNTAVVWEWLASDHVSPSETKHVLGGPGSWDIYHCNSVDEDANGNILVSLRHADAVYDIDRASKNVVWKLGGTSTTKDAGAHVFSFATQGENGPSGQHDARFQPNGQISLYDDETFVSGGVARGVVYSLDTSTWSATRVAQFPTPLNTAAGFTGSFRPYADGSNVVGWGGLTGGSGFTDFASDGSTLLDVKFPNHTSNSYDLTYRSIKVPIATFDIAALRATAGRNSQPAPVLQVDAPIRAFPQDVSAPGLTVSGATVATLVDGDPQGSVSTFSATIDWGDGSTPASALVSAAGQGQQPFFVSGSHTYRAAGTYVASVSIADSGGSTTAVTADVFAGRERRLAAAGSDGAMWTRGPEAGAWQWFGGVLTGAPAVAALPQADGSVVPLSIVVGSDNGLWATVGQSAWYPLSTGYTFCFDTPGAVVTSAGGTSRLVVACEGSDHRLWIASTPLSIGGLPRVSSFFPAGGYLTAGPALIPDGQGGFSAYVEGTDRVYSWTPATNAFAPTPWQCIGRPSVALASDSVAYFACRGTDDGLWIATNVDFTGWGGAVSAGGILRGPAGIAAFRGDALVSVQGTDAGVWETTVTWNAHTTPFHTIGGVVTDGLGAAALSG